MFYEDGAQGKCPTCPKFKGCIAAKVDSAQRQVRDPIRNEGGAINPILARF